MISWIIYDRKQFEKNSWFANKLLNELETFSNSKIIIVEDLKFGIENNKSFIEYKNEKINLPDFAVVRTIFPTLSEFLEKNGVKLFNNFDTSRICNDKRLTYLMMKNSNVPILKTSFYNKQFFDIDNIEEFPCVLKSNNGHGGSEVFFIKNKSELKENIEKITSNEFLLQDVCPTLGKDMRVYVLNGKIIASILRTSENFKSNFSLGGNAEVVDLNKAQKTFIEKIIKQLPMKPFFIGIDFLINNNELIFNEIEDVVGCRMIYDKTDIDIVKRFCEEIRNNLTNN